MIMSSSRRTVGLRIACVVAMLAGLGACAGYVPGRQSYWDSRVRELCATDGGAKIYETVTLSPQDYARLSDLVGSAKDDQGKPYVVSVSRTTIRESHPAVGRIVTKIVRRSDGKILGESIRYWRRGGDFPTGISEPSMYVCPEVPNLSTQVFKIGESK